MSDNGTKSCCSTDCCGGTKTSSPEPSAATVAISNCVLNLSPDKPQVWREIARVLKPGGRVAVSDLALLRPLPESVKADVEALVGCIAGAVLVDETRAHATDAGLIDVVLTPRAYFSLVSRRSRNGRNTLHSPTRSPNAARR